MSEDFRPGLYRHYEGWLYTAICLVTHHDGRHPMVLYVSLTNGVVNVRPLHGVPGDPDGFLDDVTVTALAAGMVIAGNPDVKVPRFERIEP